MPEHVEGSVCPACKLLKTSEPPSWIKNRCNSAKDDDGLDTFTINCSTCSRVINIDTTTYAVTYPA